MRVLLPFVIVAAVSQLAHADEYDALDAHTMRSFYLGASGGVAFGSEYDDYFMEDQTVPVGAAGINTGINFFVGSSAISVDAYILPYSEVYVARGSLLLGHHWTRDYSEPCGASPGMTCTATFYNRHVRSLFGLKLGGAAGQTPDGTVTTVEVGLGLRSQFMFEAAFQYDPIAGAPGGTMDMAVQFRLFYFGLHITAIAEEGNALPFLALFNIGYAKNPW